MSFTTFYSLEASQKKYINFVLLVSKDCTSAHRTLIQYLWFAKFKFYKEYLELVQTLIVTIYCVTLVA